MSEVNWIHASLHTFHVCLYLLPEPSHEGRVHKFLSIFHWFRANRLKINATKTELSVQSNNSHNFSISEIAFHPMTPYPSNGCLTAHCDVFSLTIISLGNIHISSVSMNLSRWLSIRYNYQVVFFFFALSCAWIMCMWKLKLYINVLQHNALKIIFPCIHPLPN